MNAKEALLSRRSCRKYEDKPVPKEIVEEVLLAGRSAPTGMNKQEIKFNVICNNKKLLQSVGEKCFNGLPEAVKPRFIKRKEDMGLTDPIFYDAHCAIILTFEKANDRGGSLEIDAGIATGNILTSLTSHGLSAVPVGIAKLGNEAAVLEALGTNKEKEELLLCIPFGYAHPDWKAKFLSKKELVSKVNWVQ